jgi:hypothetical protein
MKVFRIVAVIALLTGPAYAQTPELIHSFGPEKTPRQKADDELREKFSKEKKIPEADVKKSSVDPWGNVRSGNAAKSSTSTNPKTATSAKPRTKTGADAN